MVHSVLSLIVTVSLFVFLNRDLFGIILLHIIFFFFFFFKLTIKFLESTYSFINLMVNLRVNYTKMY
jgi:hypothetical protein